ncbi:MAG TPA: hypothetical protein VK571_10990 [Gemmatimonadaceae bacterium]|nr:hypothetical protein [Gemmatimonadaceae bacterium]
MTPIPTPEQAVHVLEVLEQWTKRGWRYEVDPKTFCVPGEADSVYVHYTNPLNPYGWDFADGNEEAGACRSRGVNHFDALCQATTVMQVLLEEHPEKL